jgi:hypothetical protein
MTLDKLLDEVLVRLVHVDTPPFISSAGPRMFFDLCQRMFFDLCQRVKLD